MRPMTPYEDVVDNTLDFSSVHGNRLLSSVCVEPHRIVERKQWSGRR